jgi:hypothetical protein
MEKYLRGLDETATGKFTAMPLNMADQNNNEKGCVNYNQDTTAGSGSQQPAVPELSKWLVSAANFTPSKNNYIDWDNTK